MRHKIIGLMAMFAALLMACSSQADDMPAPDTALSSAIQDEVIKSGALSGLYKNAGPDTPVVLIVPGSGPTNLNGNNPLGIKSDAYKQLAANLAEAGISTVRVDKRGMFSSAAAGDPNAVTLDIYTADYWGWADVIRAKTNQPCVYMLGHSEGALMVSAASADNDNVCGLILVSGLGRSYGDVLRAQLKANPANFPILRQANAAIKKLENGKTVNERKLHKGLQPLFSPAVQGFLMSVMKVDPAQVAKAANKPVLIIQGTTDIQTSVEDAELLANATGGKLVIIDGVNHVLKEAPKNRRKNIATYSKPELPISPKVTAAIADFVLQ